ncbi:MAG: hypothetical protein GKS05_04290 [Nitrospirales bacterium]|nr:hypothetical protein [Nitrospirales bacterium]
MISFEKLKQCLSKPEIIHILEIIDQVAKIKDHVQLKTAMVESQKLVPCNYLVGGLLAIEAPQGFKGFSRIINASFPSDWIRYYIRMKLYDVDPILQQHVQNFSTQVWQKTFQNVTEPKALHFIQEAKSFGLSQGITLGIFDHRLKLGSFFSFCGPLMARNKYHTILLEFLLIHLHSAMIRVHFTDTKEHQGIHLLTSREREVLLWIIRGKTNWEIGKILEISERTVKFHVENIFAKLDVKTRSQAVGEVSHLLTSIDHSNENKFQHALSNT